MAAKHEGSDSIRYGAYIYAIAAFQFIVAMYIAQFNYACTTSCYNILTNPISDLGNTVTSTYWYVFNYSLMLFGALLFTGTLFIMGAFPKSIFRSIGVVLLSIAAFASAGVGVVPENTILAIHSYFALIAFLLSGLGILLLGIKSMPKSKFYRIYTLISGIIPVFVLLFFLLPSGGIQSGMAMSGPGVGFGAIERVIAMPPILWILVTGVYFLIKRRI